MSDPRQLSNADWEGNLAVISSAGIRLLVQAEATPTASAEATYTMTHVSAKRVVIFHNGSDNEYIRVNQDATATAAHMPVIAGAYLILEAVKDDVIHLFNTHSTAITVNIVEIR